MRKINTLLFIVLIPLNLFSQTIVNISNTVTNPNPTPFGINWSERNANRGLNAFNNQTGDPGFGRQIIRIKGTCNGGGTTFLEHSDNSTLDYFETLNTGMFDGGEVRIYRETPAGITLIRTSTIINFIAEPVYRVTFAAGPAVQAGDIYVLSKVSTQDLNQYAHPRLTWIVDGANTWDKIVDDQNGLGNENDVVKSLSSDVPPNGGTTSCKIVNTNPNNMEVGIGQYISSSPLSGEFSFDPAKTYQFTVWMKQTGIANGSVNLETTTTGLAKNFTVTNTWQQYSYTVNGVIPGAAGSAVDFLKLSFDGTGTLYIDNFTLHNTATPLYSLLPQLKQELINYKPHNIRIWSGQTNGELGTNIDDWTDVPLQSAKLWNVNQGPTTGEVLKLPVILPICDENNIAPYLICSPSFSENDFLGLMEYLGGPTSTPYGAKRAAQGHPAPYTASLPKIYIELGNETWNMLFAPWYYDFNGARYPKFAQYFFNVIKSSPYYDPDKFEFVVGGFFVTPDQFGYGQEAVKKAPDAKQMLVANYIGGFDGLNIPTQPTFADTIQKNAFYMPWITKPIIDEHVTTRNSMTSTGFPYQLGVYEAGPGYALPDPGNPFNLSAEAIGKSLSSGMANLDAFLYQSEKGFGIQDLFLFARGYNWSSHTAESQGLRPHTHFLALQMRNRYAKGSMVTTSITNNTTTFLPLIDGNNNGTYDGGYGEAASGNYDNIAAYSFKDNANYSIFILNRKTTAPIPVTINLPPGAAMSGLKLYKLTGDPTQSNSDALNFSIQEENITIPPNSSSYSFTMPAGSIYLFNTQNQNVLSLMESGNDNSIRMFPNPSSDKVFVVLKESFKGKILVINVLGQTILTEEINGKEKTFDVRSLPAGVYFVKIGGNIQKLIKK